MYTKITPKVGDKFRVVKDLVTRRDKKTTTKKKGMTIVIEEVIDGDCFRTNPTSWLFSLDCLTTEYLEPVSACTFSNTNLNEMINSALENMNRIPNDWILPEFNNPKQTTMNTTMNKLTSALKRALSKDEQTLYKAGLIGSDLELTGQGQSDYTDALFNNEGDHKKAVAEMVEMASEDND